MNGGRRVVMCRWAAIPAVVARRRGLTLLLLQAVSDGEQMAADGHRGSRRAGRGRSRRRSGGSCARTRRANRRISVIDRRINYRISAVALDRVRAARLGWQTGRGVR